MSDVKDLYTKAKPDEHYMKGTVLPRRDKVPVKRQTDDTAPRNGGRIEENLVEEDENGEPITRRITKAANTAAAAPAMPLMVPTESSAAATEDLAVADLPIVKSVTPAVPGDHFSQLTQKPAPKTKVKFVGPFGSLTVPYDHVHREGIYVICTQNSTEGAFFEAPQSEQLVEVHLGAEVLMCYSGPQFRLSANGKLFITVFLVDTEATEGRKNGYQG